MVCGLLSSWTLNCFFDTPVMYCPLSFLTLTWTYTRSEFEVCAAVPATHISRARVRTRSRVCAGMVAGRISWARTDVNFVATCPCFDGPPIDKAEGEVKTELLT